MSAPLDLLSESLSSTSSLINQLMLKQHRNERALGGPMASALSGKQSGRFQPFRRRRQTTTASTTTLATEDELPASTRETLVYACPEPEGCPPPIRGQKYEPVKITASAAQNANLEKPRDVLDTIYRQNVKNVKNNKKVMRVRKKQRKPSKPKKKKEKLEKEETPAITLKAVEMVSEMIKEAGPVLTQQEIEIIADVSQEVGAKVNEKQVKVISMLSEAMGPNLSSAEIKTIAEVASTLDEDSTLASDSTLKVVAEMIKSKVGQTMTPPQLEKIKEVMTQEKPSEEEPVEEAKQSGLTDHGAEMVAQMMNNIGSDASAAEVQIVAEMIKELDKDVPRETAEVMAQVLQELMPEVTPELVHNVSAVLTDETAGNLVKEQIEMVAEVIKQSPPLTVEISPEVIEMVAEMAVEEQMSAADVVKVIEQETNSVIQESDVQTIKEVAKAVMKENKVRAHHMFS